MREKGELPAPAETSSAGTGRVSALKAWGSIVSNKARVDAIIAAAEVELSGEKLDRYKRLMEDAKLLAGARNLVAHGAVYFRHEGEWVTDNPTLETPGPFILGPAAYNTSKMKDGSFYLFCLGEIEAIGMEIQKMQSRVAGERSGEYHRYLRLTLR